MPPKMYVLLTGKNGEIIEINVLNLIPRLHKSLKIRAPEMF